MIMSKYILGLDVGSNSIGWALLEENNRGVSTIIGLGSRIFTKAVEEKTPTPKNVTRRGKRLGRRVLQRRASRKKRMINYLISLDLLPQELQKHPQPEIILNGLGDPYALRTKALDDGLAPHEFGRVLLHFVARRGFLSSKKQLAGDLIDDPDTVDYLETLDNASTDDPKDESQKEESQFKAEITELRKNINSNTRTLGEYLHKRNQGECKRNRNHTEDYLRTDRAMYQDELKQIWQKQSAYFKHLPDDFMQDKKGIKEIIFYQRPLKLKKDRVGKCSIEKNNNRAAMARLEVQQFRYLQDINNLKYSKAGQKETSLDKDQKKSLIEYFENNEKIKLNDIKKLLGLNNKVKFNLDSKKLKGNTTACKIRHVLGDMWNNYSEQEKQSLALVEDLLTIKKKSNLKTRLLNHWKLDTQTAVKLCLLEFEPSHSNHSLKAINKLLPYLKQGLLYSEARQEITKEYPYYGYDTKVVEPKKTLAAPEKTSNPIVNRGMHELKRVVNAVIKEYGKLDIVRIEMARDLEMNTKRYAESIKRQKQNEKANDEAIEEYKRLGLGDYPQRNDKIKYRLWKDQGECCAYSGKKIMLNAVFTAEVEIDHILPYSKTLDDSYMNKVLAYESENRFKSNRTPIDAWGGNEEKWYQIVHRIDKWKGLDSKVKRFHQTDTDLQQRDFISSQLNDTRYIATLALGYMKQLDCDVSVTKGSVVAEIRHQWGLNSLIGETDKKERTDHRHHAIDAIVIAATSRSLYQHAVNALKITDRKITIPMPSQNFRNDVNEQLSKIIVSHDVQLKLSGALHEDTGAGFIEQHGGTVYRKPLNPGFTTTVSDILDETVKNQIVQHLAKYNNDPKKAFASDVTVYHKNGKTPIKRVRVRQAGTTLKKLEQSKVGIKDQSGKIFKWMAKGNNHHVEIIQNRDTGKYKGEFVPMIEAQRRAMTGTVSAKKRSVKYESMIKQDHGTQWQFLYALHINDIVSLEDESGKQIYYRVQKLKAQNNVFFLREHLAANLNNKQQEKIISINKENFEKHNLKKHKVNVIGKLIDDKADC